MDAWLVALLALIGLSIVAWRWVLARRQLRQAEQLLAHVKRDQQQATDELAALHVQQVAVGMAVNDALLVLDAERRIVWANSLARQLFDDPVGKTLIEATRSHELEALLEDMPHTEGVLSRQVMLGEQAFGVRLVTMPEGCILAMEDVSELQRLGRARRDFVANISHELRTPLASIRLLVDTLQAGALSDPAVAPDMLSKINVEVDALSQLAQELLDLAMIESGQMPLKLAATNVCELVLAQVERFLPQAQQKGIALLSTLDICPTVLADQGMVARVLANLLHNAIKFTPEGGRVAIGIKLEGDTVTLSVADTGPGIPREALPRIFERFYKVDRARGQSGTGLGLAVARHIVEGHGGKIWAASEPGQGATFYFTLPAG